MDLFRDILKDSTTTRETWFDDLPTSGAVIWTTVGLFVLKATFKVFQSCLSPNQKGNVEVEVPSIPSLPSIPIVGPFYPLLWKDFGKLFTSWMRNYGTTFQSKVFGRTVVVLSDPSKLQKLLTSAEPGHLLKYPALYHNLFPSVMKTGLIATSNIPDWKHNRSVLSKAFSLESLKAYITVFNRHAKTLVNDMHENVRDDILKQVNQTKTLHEFLRESTFDSTSDIIIGTNMLSAEEKLRVHDNFARSQDIISYRYYHPWCLIEFIWKFHSQKKEMDELIYSLVQMFHQVVKDGRENSEEKSVKSFIDYMDAAGLDSNQIVAEVSNSFSAAYDTDECRKEIDEIFYSLSGSCDEVDGEVTFEALLDMKYLEMCIKETLRIFTPIPVFLRELGTPLTLDANLVLGKGTLVFIAPGLIHRDPNVYPDPMTYDPDRFLPQNCKSRSTYSFLPFSYGTRNCIGWKLAMIQIKLLASYILRHYEVYTENSYENLSEVWNTSIWPTKDLGVRWRRRKQTA